MRQGASRGDADEVGGVDRLSPREGQTADPCSRAVVQGGFEKVEPHCCRLGILSINCHFARVVLIAVVSLWLP